MLVRMSLRNGVNTCPRQPCSVEAAHVWLGPLGVENHPAAMRPSTIARIKSVGSEDDMVDKLQ